MAKPILVVYLCIEGLSMENIVRNQKHATEVCKRVVVDDDYYVFVLPTTNDSHIEVFYEKDIDDISYKELEDKINKALNINEKN